jgi:prevent-host-death family protein
MTFVNIYDAKTNLSRLIKQVCAGQLVIIGKAGQPLGKMVPYQPEKKKRQPGAWKGKVKIHDDFDELPEDIMKAFTDPEL